MSSESILRWYVAGWTALNSFCSFRFGSWSREETLRGFCSRRPGALRAPPSTVAMGPRTLAASLLSLAHLASSQPDITRATDWRWNKASYVDKNGAPASTAGRTSLVPFGIWGTARQGWQLARAWQGGFVPMPNYAAQGTMALMRHVASKQHPEALAAPAPHPFYNIGAQENLGDGGAQNNYPEEPMGSRLPGPGIGPARRIGEDLVTMRRAQATRHPDLLRHSSG